MRGDNANRTPEVLSSGGEYDDFLQAVAHAPARKPPPDVPLGSRWGDGDRYILERRLGRGGMGIVYAATDTLLGRLVALKVLDGQVASEVGAHALLREARLAARIEHERVARVYDVGEHEGSLFVAMEFVRGQTLRTWMTGRRVERPHAISIATQIAEGLAALHETVVIHRDLKPENVMLSEQGGVKLLDFGLARHAAEAAEAAAASAAGVAGQGEARPETRRSVISGTPGYMAPEQRNGAPSDPRIDVYALGVVLYELVCGERPFRGRTLEEIFAAAQRPLLFDGESWQGTAPALRAFIAKAVAVDPRERYADGVSALVALRALVGPFAAVPIPETFSQLGIAPTISVPYEPQAPAAPAKRRWKTWKTMVAAALVVGLGVGVLTGARARRSGLALLPPPPGMAWIDVGTIEVGRSRAQIERECAEIGPTCNKERMEREIPAASAIVAPFAIDLHELTNQELADALTNMNPMLVVSDDDEEHYPRYVKWAQVVGRSEVLVDLHRRRGGVQFTESKRAMRPTKSFEPAPGHEREPAVQVTWFGARAVCAALGKRLPTEDEWEAAARGREDRRFPWGNELPRCNGVVVPRDGLVPMDPSCPESVSLRAVGEASQDVTPQGVLDLGGNVTEWTDSAYVEGNRAERVESTRADLPKVIRGGSWAASLLARTSGRTRRAADFLGGNLGFRCAVSRDSKK